MYIDVEVNKGGAWKSITPSLGSLNFDDSKSDDLGYVETFMMRSPLVKDYALFHTLGLDVPELEEFIADKTLLISVLVAGNDWFAIL